MQVASETYYVLNVFGIVAEHELMSWLLFFDELIHSADLDFLSHLNRTLGKNSGELHINIDLGQVIWVRAPEIQADITLSQEES